MSYPYQIQSLDEYKQAYQRSVEDPESFWSDVAGTFIWRKRWDEVLNGNFTGPDVKWFRNGRLNITENCLDRYLQKQGDRPALIWEPNDPDEHHRVLTYKNLYDKVCQFAHVLQHNGVKKGDRVCIYMGMIPELAIA